MSTKNSFKDKYYRIITARVYIYICGHNNINTNNLVRPFRGLVATRKSAMPPRNAFLVLPPSQQTL